MRTLPLTAALLLLVAPGCVRGTTHDLEFPGPPTPDAPPEPPGELRELTVQADEDMLGEGAPASVDAVAPVPVVHLLPPEPVLFRLGAGYGALGHIDFASCREQGLQAGYLHLRVTFRRSGHVVRAAVESPVAPPPEALDCIGEQLAMAMVPVFDGGDITLSRSYFVN